MMVLSWSDCGMISSPQIIFGISIVRFSITETLPCLRVRAGMAADKWLPADRLQSHWPGEFQQNLARPNFAHFCRRLSTRTIGKFPDKYVWPYVHCVRIHGRCHRNVLWSIRKAL